MSITFGGKTAKDFAANVDHSKEARLWWEKGERRIEKIVALEIDLRAYYGWLQAHQGDERYAARRAYWVKECNRRYEVIDEFYTIAGKFERAASQCREEELDAIHAYAREGWGGMHQLLADMAPVVMQGEPSFWPSEGLESEPGY
jgi:hypothetical protein